MLSNLLLVYGLEDAKGEAEGEGRKLARQVIWSDKCGPENRKYGRDWAGFGVPSLYINSK